VPTGEYKVDVTPPAGWALADPTGLLQVLSDRSPQQFIGLKRITAQTTTNAAAAPQLPTTGAPVRLIAAIGGGVVAMGIVLLALARYGRATS